MSSGRAPIEVAEVRSTATATHDRPRVVLVTDRLPGTTSGYSIRVGNVVEGLREVGHVHAIVLDESIAGEVPAEGVFDSADVVRVARLPRSLRASRLVSRMPSGIWFRRHRAVRAAVCAAVDRARPDVIWCSRPRAFVVSAVPRRTVPVVVDLDDLHDELLLSNIRARRAAGRSIFSTLQNGFDTYDAFRWRRLQRRIVRISHAVVVCSDDDRRSLGSANVRVAPNGYPRPDRPAAHGTQSPPTMLFVGPLTYEPNRLGVEWLIDEVLPLVRIERPDVQLRVVGTLPRQALATTGPSDGVHLLGFVDDLGPEFDRATVVVAPVPSGGGTRLKIIEGFARRLPVVATSFAAAGLDVVDDEHLLLADSASDFAAACRRLLADESERDRLVDAAYVRYEERLSSEVAARRVAAIAWEAVGRPTGVGVGVDGRV
jgi:glycosyltransferase involved in cell wall biosynthesis